MRRPVSGFYRVTLHGGRPARSQYGVQEDRRRNVYAWAQYLMDREHVTGASIAQHAGVDPRTGRDRWHAGAMVYRTNPARNLKKIGDEALPLEYMTALQRQGDDEGLVASLREAYPGLEYGMDPDEAWTRDDSAVQEKMRTLGMTAGQARFRAKGITRMEAELKRRGVDPFDIIAGPRSRSTRGERTREREVAALEKARSGQSWTNYPAIYAGFLAKGIPEPDIRPRENVFTFKAWKALGRAVKKGEHGVHVLTFLTSVKEDKVTGEKKIIRRPFHTTVFHESQTRAA